ncbi:MAG: enoyl-CoA hydratase/isomerase family protein [Dehalococcoidia bacterium]|nr:enoyl-CoA hydratase/isomerase family protein [Dehalococcoidia bacterium]
MTYKYILTETRDRVGIITLNRPERLNAFNYEMQGEWRDQVEQWNQDPAIGAIVFAGAGRAFCAGADFGGWSREIQQREAGEETDRQRRARPDETWTEMAMRSKPIVCAINGPAIGVGLTMTLPGDVRIASDRARLSMRFVRVGVIPELGSTRLLPQIVGVSHALELMLSGRIIDAAEAGRIGLVNRVVPHDELLDRAVETAAGIAFNPLESLAAVKQLTWSAVNNLDIRGVMEQEGKEFAAAQQRPAFKEAVTAFREKREPNFHP